MLIYTEYLGKSFVYICTYFTGYLKKLDQFVLYSHLYPKVIFFTVCIKKNLTLAQFLLGHIFKIKFGAQFNRGSQLFVCQLEYFFLIRLCEYLRGVLMNIVPIFFVSVH